MPEDHVSPTGGDGNHVSSRSPSTTGRLGFRIRNNQGNRTPGSHSGPSGFVLYFPAVTVLFPSYGKVPRPSTPPCPRESRLKCEMLLILLYSRLSMNI